MIICKHTQPEDMCPMCKDRENGQVDTLVMCAEHPDNIATHTKLSWIKNKPRIPICIGCHDAILNSYRIIYDALEIKRI